MVYLSRVLAWMAFGNKKTESLKGKTFLRSAIEFSLSRWTTSNTLDYLPILWLMTDVNLSSFWIRKWQNCSNNSKAFSSPRFSIQNNKVNCLFLRIIHILKRNGRMRNSNSMVFSFIKEMKNCRELQYLLNALLMIGTETQLFECGTVRHRVRLIVVQRGQSLATQMMSQGSIGPDAVAEMSFQSISVAVLVKDGR